MSHAVCIDINIINRIRVPKLIIELINSEKFKKKKVCTNREKNHKGQI